MPESILFYKKIIGNKIPASTNLNVTDKKFLDNLLKKLPHLINLMNNQNLNEYIKTVVGFSFDANKYFNISEPWKEKR